jgi:hypothetical protein
LRDMTWACFLAGLFQKGPHEVVVRGLLHLRWGLTFSEKIQLLKTVWSLLC